MTVLYYDPFAGISGDMHLGALVDLGVPIDYLKSELSKLGLDGYTIESGRENRKGIEGTRVQVHTTHNHEHEHHTHQHRAFSDIKAMIEKSGLSSPVKSKSIELFEIVGKSEAKIHGVSLEKIHFHEVGAVDSIVDIVGAAVCIDYIKPDMIISSSIELGGGFVKCAHGTFPVPAPATAEILRGVPVKTGAVNSEATTPTGAAIMKAFVKEFVHKQTMTIDKIGYGIGGRDTEIPNVLRVFLGTMEKEKRTGHCVLECNIDDMIPEVYDYLMDKLFETGADDVYFTPVIMKKSRPAVKVSVLCSEELADKLEEVLFMETSTFGIRKTQVEKNALERSFEVVETELGRVSVKTAFYKGKKIKSKPEYSDCRTLAEKNGRPLRDILGLFK